MHPSGILSVFARDTIHGSVYVEATTFDDVKSVLREVGGSMILQSHHHRPRMDLVPLDERVPLLDMGRMTGMDISILSWVRLKCRGKYRNDLGLVLEFNPLDLMVTVYVVPRIDMSDRMGKRKRSSEPIPTALFNAEAVRCAYGADSVEKLNQVFRFKKDIYKNGLLEKEVHLTKLSCTDIHPTQYELDTFRLSEDEQVIQALNAAAVSLNIGDRVQAVTGTFRGLTGHVVDIHEDCTVLFEHATDGEHSQFGREDVSETSKTTTTRVQICSSEVRRKFELGDFVHVLHGVHSGDDGYIVELNGEDATLYKRCITSGTYSTQEQPGVEVNCKLAFLAEVDASLRS
jgi:ribosomal protein L24